MVPRISYRGRVAAALWRSRRNGPFRANVSGVDSIAAVLIGKMQVSLRCLGNLVRRQCSLPMPRPSAGEAQTRMQTSADACCGREHRGDSCARTTLWRRRWRAARVEPDDRRSTGDASSRSWRTAKRFRRRRSLSLSACLFTPLQKSAAAESAQRMATKQSVNFIVKACSSACRRSPTRRSSSDALSAAILVPWRRRSTTIRFGRLTSLQAESRGCCF